MSSHDIILVFGVKKNKITGYTFSDTHLSAYKIMKSNIFFRPEEAMLETGKSLSSKSKLVLCVWMFLILFTCM